MHKIGIIERIAEEGISLIKNNKKFQYEIIEDVSKENLIKVLPNFDGITLRVAKLDSEILKYCKKLKVISRHGVGYDNVDLNFLKKKKYKTFNYSDCQRCICSGTCNVYDSMFIKRNYTI